MTEDGQEDVFTLHEQNMTEYKKNALFVCGKPLQIGVVYTVDSVERFGKCYHNSIGVIIRINKTTVNICFQDGNVYRVKIHDLKCIIGTKELDLGCWGNERHQKQIKPFINKAQKKFAQYFN